ncbi:hypothetical protein GCM10010341_22040 [Streptomyces noursei]|nr:hypothetical protein GCM10010341_22040 [Streptomyces noursei]
MKGLGIFGTAVPAVRTDGWAGWRAGRWPERARPGRRPGRRAGATHPCDRSVRRIRAAGPAAPSHDCPERWGWLLHNLRITVIDPP